MFVVSGSSWKLSDASRSAAHPRCPGFDGERVLDHRSVLLADGKISQIGGLDLHVANADIVDGLGRTLLPGFIDAHVHLPDHAEDACRQALVLGVTTQLDMFSAGARLKQIKQVEEEDRPNLADVRTAGAGATVPGGHPTQMGGRAAHAHTHGSRGGTGIR